MSYLLKALKKAEQERQQQVSPEDVVAPVAVNISSLPTWLIVVVLVFLLVTAIKLFLPESKNTSATEEIENISLLHEAPSMAEQSAELLVITPDFQNKQPLLDLSQPLEAQEAEVAQTKVFQLAELPKEVLQQIPTLSLESHIYSSAAEYRSVVINGQSFNEGAFINRQVVLHEITNTGIIINVAGRQVALAKGMSWVAAKNVK